MTPLQIEILMHYHCRTDDYRNGDFSASAVREAIDEFRNMGFLRDSGERRIYEPSDGVRLYVETLCTIPLPVQRWVMP